MRVKSSARVKRTGACKEAATVCPGSTLRASTTPLIGERMTALVRLVWSEFSVASACCTLARASSTLANARARFASAVLTSEADTICPFERLDNSRRR